MVKVRPLNGYQKQIEAAGTLARALEIKKAREAYKGLVKVTREHDVVRLKCKKSGSEMVLNWDASDEEIEEQSRRLVQYGQMSTTKEEAAALATQQLLAHKMYSQALKVNEAWMNNISVGEDKMLPGLLGPPEEKPVPPPPKIVYTASAPGRCKECGLKTVLTRNEKDVCQACDAEN